MSEEIKFPAGYKNRELRRRIAKSKHKNLFTKAYKSKAAKDYAFSLQSEDIINEDIKKKRLFRMFKAYKNRQKKEDKYNFKKGKK